MSNGRHLDKAKPTIGEDADPWPENYRAMKSRIMYIEDKASGIQGSARIGRVFFSKTGKTLYYNGMRFRSLKGSGFKSNYYNVDTGDEYWISGPRKDQDDRLYGGFKGVEIDEDVREEYVDLLAMRGE